MARRNESVQRSEIGGYVPHGSARDGLCMRGSKRWRRRAFWWSGKDHQTTTATAVLLLALLLFAKRLRARRLQAA